MEACDWIGGERCPTGCEKSAESLPSRFGHFGVVLGPNEVPMGSFESLDLKLSPPSVKPAQNHEKTRELKGRSRDSKTRQFRRCFASNSLSRRQIGANQGCGGGFFDVPDALVVSISSRNAPICCCEQTSIGVSSPDFRHHFRLSLCLIPIVGASLCPWVSIVLILMLN